MPAVEDDKGNKHVTAAEEDDDEEEDTTTSFKARGLNPVSENMEFFDELFSGLGSIDDFSLEDMLVDL